MSVRSAIRKRFRREADESSMATHDAKNTVDQFDMERMACYIRQNANSSGEVILVDDLYDSYSITCQEGKFFLINFSPRENSVYSRREIPPAEALEYLRMLL